MQPESIIAIVGTALGIAGSIAAWVWARAATSALDRDRAAITKGNPPSG